MEVVRGKEAAPSDEGDGTRRWERTGVLDPVAPAVRPYLCGVPLEVGSSRRDDRAVEVVRGKEAAPSDEGDGTGRWERTGVLDPVAPAVRPYLCGVPLEVGSSRRDDRAVEVVRGKEAAPLDDEMGRGRGSGRGCLGRKNGTGMSLLPAKVHFTRASPM
ncbi:hypothetical protein llg_28310 [Luteolibacter sp. LG18]|nr:hypothetical protein llg_28310 [Luteolibacter sp. LG18]